jgi:hypothetical protein
MKALKIASDTVEVVEVNGYEEIKSHLDGGWVEVLYLDDNASAYIDEEGKMKGLPYNAVATELCTRLKTGLQQGDFISGTMIVLGYALCREEDTDCPDYIIEMVETMRVVTNKQTKGETNV